MVPSLAKITAIARPAPATHGEPLANPAMILTPATKAMAHEKAIANAKPVVAASFISVSFALT